MDNSLLIKFPNLAQEWDYSRNNDLRPENVSYGSHLDVYWICPICHQSYKKRICNRTAPSRSIDESKKCPICLGRVIIPGVNSLKAKFPEIVSLEWDYQKNIVDPDRIPPHRNKPKYWWKCKNGHSYQASANNKTSQTGGNCPYCSHQRFIIDNSLAKCNPSLAKEWCKYKNKLTPEQVFVSSNKYAWWKCERGHIWSAKINNRNNGRGCPQCSKWRQTSFPEQVIFYYVNKILPDAINGYKFQNKELDIYIPSLKLGIEYDGEYYHRGEKKLKNDLAKNNFFASNGVSLIRIRESNCTPINDNSCVIFIYEYKSSYNGLESIIYSLLSYIGDKYKIRIPIIDIKISSIRRRIIEKLSLVPIGDSLEYRNIPLSEDWDCSKNYPLTPKLVSPNSTFSVFWKCHICGYEWEAVIGSRNNGVGCPRCSKRERYTLQSWILKANNIHNNKYDYSSSKYINAKTPIDIICPIHGVFSQLPSEHLAGKGCKWCGSQGGYHEFNTLAHCFPELAKEWDYDHPENKGLTPKDVVITDNKNSYWWKCSNGKPHSYSAKISYRIKRNSGCAVCHGKQISYDKSLANLRPDLCIEWSPNNILKPWEVSCGSERRIIWKCSNPKHREYSATPYSRVHLKSGCPECAGNIKSPLVYKEEMQQKHPSIELLCDYQKSNIRIKCRCIECGYEWTPYPYNVLRGKGCPKCNIEMKRQYNIKTSR